MMKMRLSLLLLALVALAYAGSVPVARSWHLSAQQNRDAGLRFMRAASTFVATIPEKPVTDLDSMSDCLVPHTHAGCDNDVLEAAVCAEDALCCAEKAEGRCGGVWDRVCVTLAHKFLDNNPSATWATCGADRHYCELANVNGGCRDGRCCQRVCQADASCCNDQWDRRCVNLARELCVPRVDVRSPSCDTSDVTCIFQEQDPINGRLYPSGSPGCENPSCCDAVTTLDPVCAQLYGRRCSELAQRLCTQDARAAMIQLAASTAPPPQQHLLGGPLSWDVELRKAVAQWIAQRPAQYNLTNLYWTAGQWTGAQEPKNTGQGVRTILNLWTWPALTQEQACGIRNYLVKTVTPDPYNGFSQASAYWQNGDEVCGPVIDIPVTESPTPPRPPPIAEPTCDVTAGQVCTGSSAPDIYAVVNKADTVVRFRCSMAGMEARRRIVISSGNLVPSGVLDTLSNGVTCGKVTGAMFDPVTGEQLGTVDMCGALLPRGSGQSPFEATLNFDDWGAVAVDGIVLPGYFTDFGPELPNQPCGPEQEEARPDRLISIPHTPGISNFRGLSGAMAGYGGDAFGHAVIGDFTTVGTRFLSFTLDINECFPRDAEACDPCKNPILRPGEFVDGSLANRRLDGPDLQDCLPFSTIQDDVWYRFTTPTTGWVRMDSCADHPNDGNSRTDVVIALWDDVCPAPTAGSPEDLTRCNDDNFSLNPGGVGFARCAVMDVFVEAGRKYHLQVANTDGTFAGSFYLRVSDVFANKADLPAVQGTLRRSDKPSPDMIKKAAQ